MKLFFTWVLPGSIVDIFGFCMLQWGVCFVCCCRVLKRVELGRAGAGRCSAWCSRVLPSDWTAASDLCCRVNSDWQLTVWLICSGLVLQFILITLSFVLTHRSCSAWIPSLFRTSLRRARLRDFAELHMRRCVCEPRHVCIWYHPLPLCGYHWARCGCESSHLQ